MHDVSRGAKLNASFDTPANYRADIDGLRAIAVTSVVLFHAGVWPFRSGYVGVDIFFVISGFLIGGIIHREAVQGHFSFAAFYARRARRILPALIAVTVTSLVLGLFLLSPTELQRLALSAASALGAFSNVFFWWYSNYFSPDAHLDPMLMTWSLGVEEQFYFIFPFIMLTLLRLGRRTVLGLLLALSFISFVLSLILTAKAPAFAFYLLPARAWELGVGAALAIWQQEGGKRLSGAKAEVASVAGLIAVIASIVAFDAHTPFPGAAALLPVLGTVALIASEGSKINAHLLSHRIPVGAGLISYSWYLWHWPLMAFLHITSVRPPTTLSLFIIALVSLALGVLSWRFIERPFRRRSVSNASAILRYGLVVATLAVAAGSARLLQGFPQRVSDEVVAIDAAVKATHSYRCLVRYGSALSDRGPECSSRDGQQPAVAVIGDSHAAALAPAVRQLAESKGWGFVVLTRASCRPLQGITVWRSDQPNLARDCADFMNAAFERIAKDEAVRSVVLAGLWAGPGWDTRNERYLDPSRPDGADTGAKLLASGLEQATRKLIAAGKQVFLVQDVPYWNYDPARASLIEAIPMRSTIQRALESESDPKSATTRPRSADIDQAVSQAARNAGASFLNLTSVFCRQDACTYKDRSALLYADRSHLTTQGALYALEPWAETLFANSVRPVSR